MVNVNNMTSMNLKCRYGCNKLLLVSLICSFSVMFFIAIFNHISAISWRSFIGEEYRKKPPTCCKSLKIRYRIMLYRVHLAMSGIRGNNLVVIGTDFTGSCKANYHTTMTASKINLSSDVVNFVLAEKK